MFGTVGLLAGLTGSAATAAMLLRMDRSPSITMIGSGSSMSLLIASGGARLAVLHGTDPADFGNALARARVPFLDRTDIAIVAQPSLGAHFVRSALDRLQPERAYVVGTPNELLDAGIALRDSLRAPTEFHLPRRLSLALPNTPLTDANEESWTGILDADGQSLIMSTGSHELMPVGLPEQPAAWICLDGSPPLEWLQAVQPRSLVIPAAAMSGPRLRELEAELTYQPLSTYRIHAGEATRFELPEFSG